MPTQHSRWAEVEFVSCTSARAVMPKLNRVFSLLGMPMVLGSDSGPLLDEQTFLNFSKYLGFKQVRKTAKNPLANTEAEEFSRQLKEVLPHMPNNRASLPAPRFVLGYWVTPHRTTKMALAELMFPGRKFRTRLPAGAGPREENTNEGAGSRKEGRENIGHPGQGCSTSKTITQHQNHTTFWQRVPRGAAPKGNTNGCQEERWQINGTF